MFDIILYRNTAENNRIDKTDFLYKIMQVGGTLKEECSIITPTFKIEVPPTSISYIGFRNNTIFERVKANDSFIVTDLTNSNIINANYCFIPIFNRYYFVTDIISVRNNLWSITLSCDVLMSFKQYIYNLDVYVSRQEYEVNEYLVDNKMPARLNPTYSFVKCKGNELISPKKLGSKKYCYCLITGTTQYNTSDVATKNVIKNTAVSGYTTGIHLLTSEHMYALGKYLMNETFATDISLLFSDVKNGLISLALYPLEFIDSSGKLKFYGDFGYSLVEGTTISISKGTLDLAKPTLTINSDGTFDKPIKYLGGNIYCDISLGTITFTPRYNNFLDYSPYTKINLFIPTYGFIELDADMVMGRTIEVRMTIDVFTQTSSIRIIGQDYNVIKTLSSRIGVSIPLNSSNANEIAKNILMSGMKIAMGANTMHLGSSISEAGYSGKKVTPKRNVPTANYLRFQNQQELRKEGELSNYISDTTVELASHNINGSSGDFSEGWSNYGLPFDMYAVISNTVPIYPSMDSDYTKRYRKMVGSPSSYNGKLGRLRGYTEVSGVHIEGIPNALQDELDDINSALRSGVLLPD